MHLSQDTFDQIAALLQNDAKQFRRHKLTESILFKKTDLGYTITLDNMGIGKLSIKDNQFAFSSHSALGEVFNKTLFGSLEECQAAIVSHMMGEKNESVTLAEDVEELEEGAITVDQLKVGKVYTLKDEGGTKFKAKILDISDAPKQGGQKVWEVKYEYVDNSYAKKGSKDVFIVARNEKVFHEAVMVAHDRYVRATGKKAKGSGNWSFTHKKMGDVNWKDEKDFFNVRGSFAAASKEAKEWAKKHGYSVVYVMEEVDELDETAYEKGMDPKKKVVVQGVKGMKSRPFKKTFRNEAAYDKWADSPAAEDVTVHRVYQEEVEEIDESNTTPFFLDAKTRKPMSPADEIKALQDYIKRARSESGSGSDQRLYLATQRLQYLSARVVKEETDEDEAESDEKKDKKIGDKKGKKKDSEEMDMEPKAMKESVKTIVARLKEGRVGETKIKRLDTVHAKSLNITGMVYSIKGSKVQIRTPNKMVTADIKDLEVVEMDEEKTALGEDHLGGRKDGYALYHPTYSAAVQEALKWAQRKGFKVNEDDYFNKVSTGPRKPTPGKTVSHSLALDNNKRKQLHLQIYNTGNSFELNCYVS